ncbi:siderophore-interacting protein [Kitasatospora sp. NPDC054939]
MFRRPRPTHDVTVTAVAPLTSALVRLTLGGPTLDRLEIQHPTQWVKLAIPDGTKRAYTVRHHRPGQQEVDLDVVLHGNGPAARWAATARPGDPAQLIGPRGSLRPLDDGRPLLLAADESALPAALTVLEALPPGIPVTAWFEIADPADTLPLPPGRSAVWLPRTTAEPRTAPTARTPASGRPKAALLVEALRAAELPPGPAWLAGEAGAVTTIRRHLLDDRGFAREDVQAKGYWKLGEADHKG